MISGQLALSLATRGGFRLRRFEALNWGTFHKKVWALELGGENTLLTGDIGSGKSTLVDAITTLLVAPQKLNYNKAAGAEEKERTIRSYVLGQYRKEREDGSLSVRALTLRDQNSYSALLGYFLNEALGQAVTIAVVFWMKDSQGQPARMYLVADSRLSITENIASFGTDIGNLRKRFRGAAGVEIHDAFPSYSASYRRRFGIESEQALDLFNQTVSMKSVGNLTGFVRDHMLQPFEIEPRIEALVSHFDDLQRAHEAVVKARKQISLLLPLVNDCDERTTAATHAAAMREARELLHAWFSSHKQVLLKARLSDLAAEQEKLALAKQRGEEERAALHSKRDDLRQDIAQSGGSRIERIKRDVSERQTERQARERRSMQYNAAALAAGLPAAGNAETFFDNQKAAAASLEDLAAREAEMQNGRADADYQLRIQREQHAETEAELQSLRQRRSSIPRQMLDLRARLCSSLGLGEETLPFSGELIQVRTEERDWEGAIERLLHSFGLSLLVPDVQYARVADWVNQNHLSGRLVYYRVRRQEPIDRMAARRAELLSKVELKADSPFYGWLELQFGTRFAHACCDTVEQFRREPLALTRTGQIKGSNDRHEKDDRSRIEDRGRFILGWSNDAKIAVLEQEQADLQNGIQAVGGRLAALMAALGLLKAKQDSLRRLGVFESFSDLDWKPLAVEIESLERERKELEAGSDVLRLLQLQLKETEQALAEIQARLNRTGEDTARSFQKSEQWTAALDECRALLAGTPDDQQAKLFPEIEAMSKEALGLRAITIETCDARERELREWLQARIDAEARKIARLDSLIVKAMQIYRQEYTQETNEADVSVEAADEYRKMLRDLQSDGLPRFEARFKELLNENTIREVANFQSQMNRERESIRERIDVINQSLRGIDYNPGHYILLEMAANPDMEIRQFQDDLRSCTEGALSGSGDEQYSEAKFLQVKAIIERFRGRENHVEIDRRWTRKVTDVRQWFAFSASERYREDDREFEHYTDSGGKSGGQKEKLAYTVLAASLAYQFGLELGSARSRSFRFVVIDEAFGRGSDESTRYGLKLFAELGLQLLVVTPLQKIHVIEPFVSSVGFVHIEDSSRSMLRNLTIEEYRRERAAHRSKADELDHAGRHKIAVGAALVERQAADGTAAEGIFLSVCARFPETVGIGPGPTLR